jgi:DNA primase
MLDPVEEIKQKVDIIQLIGEYVPLKKAGANNWRGRCPFHNEKTPSFFVSSDKQIFKCFGCGAGGDIFTFIQKIEGVDFPESLRILAQKAGVVLQKQDPRAISQKTRLLDICQLTVKHWQENLLAQEGLRALEYLKQRQLSMQTIKQFQLGFARDSWDDLLNFLKGKGFTEIEIFQAGFIVKKEKGSGFYDRFRGRIMFPIWDIHGNVIGCTGRILDGDEKIAKYVNTPESPLYNKGHVLYALDKAKQAIRAKDLAVLVEGNMDVIASRQAGVANVVACSGTALTPDQIKLIKRYTNNVALCFDMDAAGKIAAGRSIDLVLAEGLNTKVVQVPFGKDPDDCIKKDPQLWLDAINKSVSAMEFYFKELVLAHNLQNVDERKKAAKDFMAKISVLDDVVERDYWLKRLASEIGIDEKLLRDALPASSAGKPRIDKPTVGKPVVVSTRNKYVVLGEQLVGLLLKYPNLFAFVIDSFTPDMMPDVALAKLYENLIMCYNKQDNLEACVANQQVCDSLYLKSIILYAEARTDGFGEKEVKNEFLLTVRELKKNYFDKKIEALRREMERLGATDAAKADKLMLELQDLLKQKNNL